MTEPRVTQPEALREAAEVAATWAEGLRDDKGHPGGLRVAASVVGKRLRAALEAHGAPRGSCLDAPVGQLGSFEMFDYPDGCQRPAWIPAQAAIGAVPSSPKTLLNARTMEEAKDALRGHQAQVVASSPEAADE